MKRHHGPIVLLTITALLTLSATYQANARELKRQVSPAPQYKTLPAWADTTVIVFKLAEGIGQPEFDGRAFAEAGQEWRRLNQLLASPDRATSIAPRFALEKSLLNDMRQVGSANAGIDLPDLSLYYSVTTPTGLKSPDKIQLVNDLNSLEIVEIAYLAPKPEVAAPPREGKSDPSRLATEANTPNWENGQYYLQSAPTGVDAYYSWDFPGGRGQDIKVVDIEGNWIQTHEDLHGGLDDFHIAGARIDDPGWWNHGTAVLGEIAADSNTFGMTGIAFEVDLGTVSIGSMSTAQALVTATSNTEAGDVILIELHAPGPHYNFEEHSGQAGYVAMEYWQENFDAILTASALGRIVVEAAGNGNEDYDDQSIYGFLFDPDFRFSGAIIAGASSSSHVPASFTNYGERVDVHGFGTWDVYTLGYGDLYGSTPSTYYTNTFAGTSSASPIIVGACAALQGVYKAAYGLTLNHDEMRTLITTHSTPQASHYKNIGPLPDLRGAIDEVVGVTFFADENHGAVPLPVNFSGYSALQVDTWSWEFGDGGSASAQNVSHIYTAPGIYDVTLEIDAAGDIRSVTRSNFIIAVADTFKTDDVDGIPGESVEIVISANNTVPVREFRVPIEYSGSLSLSYDSVATTGCRTDYFEPAELVHYDPFNRRLTVKVAVDPGVQPDLPLGSGPILKVYLKISGAASQGQSAPIALDGYSSYLPEIRSPLLDYPPVGTAGVATVTSCILRGDFDNSGELNVADLVAFVDYSFNGGSQSPLPDHTDTDCSGTIDIADLVYLVEYMFSGGMAPCPC